MAGNSSGESSASESKASVAEYADDSAGMDDRVGSVDVEDDAGQSAIQLESS